MSLIELNHVTTIFGKDPKAALALLKGGAGKKTILDETGHVVGLHDVSLSIEAGELFVIMGLSGSGKSTLVRHINRLIDPTDGTILIDGVDILSLSHHELIEMRRRRIAMVFQRFGLMPHRPVLENIAYGLEVRGVKGRGRLEPARQWLGKVGLTGYESHYPDQLSGGMQQRVGLARALAADTDIILMDEAFSALDPLIRSELQDEVVALQRTLGKTIVFITHDLDEALRIADRIAILKDGTLVRIGAPVEILLNPADAYVEAFVRDVNRARALSVDTLMQPPALRLTAESIGEALAAMRRTRSTVGYVVNDGRFAGLVTKDNLKKAEKEHGAHGAALEHVEDDHPVVTQGTDIEAALPALLESSHPVAVVNEAGELEGIIHAQDVSGALMQADRVGSESEPESAENAEKLPAV